MRCHDETAAYPLLAASSPRYAPHGQTRCWLWSALGNGSRPISRSPGRRAGGCSTTGCVDPHRLLGGLDDLRDGPLGLHQVDLALRKSRSMCSVQPENGRAAVGRVRRIPSKTPQRRQGRLRMWMVGVVPIDELPVHPDLFVGMMGTTTPARGEQSATVRVILATVPPK